jgi:hexosaminidase
MKTDKIKRFATSLLAFIYFCSVKAQTPPLSIIPAPAKIGTTSGSFTVTNKTTIVLPNGQADWRGVGQGLANRFKLDGTVLPIVELNNSKSTTNVIFFIQNDKMDLGTEGYKLGITPSQINITAATAQGAFYAVQSLLQLLPTDIYSPVPLKLKQVWRLPCLEMEDRPRFGYRGLMLDVSRHFQPVSFIKRFIDLLAMHKMNTFHWHLTDDQGWRIEIKKYPKLTEIGAWRRETMVGHGSLKPQVFDGIRHGGFYTQTEIKEIVAYAKERFVTIIPEIEMPGHAQAALAAYPELSCEPSKTYEVSRRWGVHTDVFCPSEKTFGFLEDVLTEVLDLFPSKYIHIGGDECPKEAWEKSSFCQDLMKKQGLKDEHALQSYFIHRIEKFLNTKGRNLIGWDEILEGGLAPNATVMSWRGTEGGIEAAQQNHDVIMTPGAFCYLDYYQADPETEPLAIGGLLPLDKVYNYEPIPDVLTTEQAKRVLGAQGNIWTEYMKTPQYIEYMALPRAIALAELTWSPKSKRNYDDFVNRLERHFQRLDKLNINYARRLYDAKIDIKSDKAPPSVYLSTRLKNGEIRYTTNGSEPIAKSPLYSKPIDIQSNMTVKAAVFQNGRPLSKAASQTVFYHSGLGKTYTFAKPPKNTYESGKWGLTNGLRGNEKTFSQWVGFEKNDMEVIFDFGTPRLFSLISMQFLNKPSAWIFLPDYATVSVSEDGSDWRDIDRADFEHSRSLEKTYIREAKMRFSEVMKPKRYVRITAKNIGVCPKGHAGEGKAAWLFIDEISID